MEINIVKKQHGGIVYEPLDTTGMIAVEFILGSGRSIAAMIEVEDGKLYVSSTSGKLVVMPRASNAALLGSG